MSVHKAGNRFVIHKSLFSCLYKRSTAIIDEILWRISYLLSISSQDSSPSRIYMEPCVSSRFLQFVFLSGNSFTSEWTAAAQNLWEVLKLILGLSNNLYESLKFQFGNQIQDMERKDAGYQKHSTIGRLCMINQVSSEKIRFKI